MMGLVLSIFSNWRLIAALLALIAFVGTNGLSYFKGFQAAQMECQTQELHDQIKALEENMERTRNAYEHAAMRAVEREKNMQSLNEKMEAYENDLSNSPNCVLSDDDASRLRSIQ